MAGPAVSHPSRREPFFSKPTREDLPGFLGIMQVIHQEPTSSAFARLLAGRPTAEDEIPLAHLFEECSVLALRGLISEDLLFDAFAIDLYWAKLEKRIARVRTETSNPKFCENFERAAGLAAEYRNIRPGRPA